MSRKRSIPVRIQGREYKIRADGDPDTVHEAAKLLDETIDKVRARAGTVDSVDIAVLAALNLANHLIQERKTDVLSESFEQRVNALIELVGDVVGEPLSLAN